MKSIKILILIILFYVNLSYAQETVDSLLEMAMTAYETNEYEIALDYFELLKESRKYDDGKLNEYINTCKDVLSLSTYAEARVLYKERKFDEALKLLNKRTITSSLDMDILKGLCRDIKKEMNKDKPRVIWDEGLRSDLWTISSMLFGDRKPNISKPNISSAIIYKEPLAAYWDDHKNKGGYINLLNDTKFPTDYDVVTPFHEGLALVRKGKKWHYINHDNQIVIKDVGQLVFLGEYGEYDVKPGLYFTSEDVLEFYWFMDQYYFDCGDLKLAPKELQHGFFSDGIAIIYNKKKGRVGINAKGQEILEYNLIHDIDGRPDFEYWPFGSFANGYAVVKKFNYNYYGLVDKCGKTIIPFEYTFLTEYGNGLCGFKKAENYKIVDGYSIGEYGFINLKNEIVIPQKYQGVRSFHEGLSAVELNGKWGYIDTLGNTIIPFVFDKAYDFGHVFDGVAHVKLDEEDGFIDHFGFSTLDSTLYKTDRNLSYHDKVIKEIHNICPIVITNIQFSYTENGAPAEGDSISGNIATFVWPIISYHGIIDGEDEFFVKWYTPDNVLRRSDNSPRGFTYRNKMPYKKGDNNLVINAWGQSEVGSWSQKGDYLMEIWYKGRMLKSKTLRIY